MKITGADGLRLALEEGKGPPKKKGAFDLVLAPLGSTGMRACMHCTHRPTGRPIDCLEFMRTPPQRPASTLTDTTNPSHDDDTNFTSIRAPPRSRTTIWRSSRPSSAVACIQGWPRESPSTFLACGGDGWGNGLTEKMQLCSLPLSFSCLLTPRPHPHPPSIHAQARPGGGELHDDLWEEGQALAGVGQLLQRLAVYQA